jgi:hypothetical protein
MCLYLYLPNVPYVYVPTCSYQLAEINAYYEGVVFYIDEVGERKKIKESLNMSLHT